MVASLQKSDNSRIDDTEPYDNVSRGVASYLLPPSIVAEQNAAEACADDPRPPPLIK